MTGRLFRTLTPWGWLVLLLVVAAVAVVVGRGVGLRWDPFGLTARRLDSAERRAARAESDLRARRLEAEALDQQARRIDDHHQQAVALARATAAGQTQARSAHDALDPLDPARAARLRAHDGELRRLAPDLCLAAEAGAADGGEGAVSAGPVAAEPDHG